MSFLNSVLSSIGGNGAPISAPPPPTARPQSTEAGQGSNRTSNRLLPAAINTAQNKKRKAEDELPRPVDRTMKNGVTVAQTTRATTPADPRLSRPINTPLALSSKAGVPYRGTSRPDQAPLAPAKPATPPATEAAKAPKKGSYAEIMARAQATQSKGPAVGVISHKPKGQMGLSYKRELKLKRKALRNKKLAIKGGDRPSSSGSMSSSPVSGATDGKPHPQPTYHGTTKSKPQPTYRGTMKLSTSTTQKATSRDGGGRPSKPRYDEYAATDEDDLDDVEEEDYGSDESDEMEAGFSDVEQEETVAARAARKEDEEEAKLEAKLKREKEERKRRLLEMAKKAKPQKY